MTRPAHESIEIKAAFETQSAKESSDGDVQTENAVAQSPGYDARKTVSAQSRALDNSTTAEA
jgi:hypothetical protein